LNHPPTPLSNEVRHFYFKRQKLEQVVIEGLELVAHSEADADADAESSTDNSAEQQDSSINGGASRKEKDVGPVITRISKGALKMLKKHIDALSHFLEE